MKNPILSRLAAFFLAVCLLASYAVPVRAAGVHWQEVDINAPAPDLTDRQVEEIPSETGYQATDIVRVSIVLAEKSTVQAGYATMGIARNQEAMAYQDSLRTAQETMAQTISAQVLGGRALDVVWNLTLVGNIISANVPYGKLEEIRQLPGVEERTFTCDGSVTIADAAMLFHYVSGLFPSLPFEEGEYARLVVQTMPDKTEYVVGEDFDYGGLLVCAEYDGGKRVPLETYTLSALGTSTATGVKIVTVSAGGLQTAFTVTVLPDALTGIELTALPTKRTYVLGETLDLAGLRVNAVYASGTKAQISAYAVDGFDGSRAGVQTVTVFYRGFSKTFTVTVSASSAATVNTGSSALNVRSAPSLTASVVGTFAAGTRVEVLSREGEWTKVRGKTAAGTTLTGYCYTEYLLFD